MQSLMKRYLTDREQRVLLATVKSHGSVLARRDFHWIRFLRDMGLRIEEFALSNCYDARFALSTGWLHIPRERRKGRRRDHDVPLGAPARESLKALLEIHVEMGGAAGDEDPLVLSRERGRMSVRSYQERLGQWCEVAKIERASPHWLRHTRAMNVMAKSDAKDPRGIVQKLLGHESISSTGVYTGATKEDLLAAVDQVDGGRRLRRGQVRKAYAQGRAS